jgi:hypothetical protein
MGMKVIAVHSSSLCVLWNLWNRPTSEDHHGLPCPWQRPAWPALGHPTSADLGSRPCLGHTAWPALGRRFGGPPCLDSRRAVRGVRCPRSSPPTPRRRSRPSPRSPPARSRAPRPAPPAHRPRRAGFGCPLGPWRPTPREPLGRRRNPPWRTVPETERRGVAREMRRRGEDRRKKRIDVRVAIGKKAEGHLGPIRCKYRYMRC